MDAENQADELPISCERDASRFTLWPIPDWMLAVLAASVLIPMLSYVTEISKGITIRNIGKIFIYNLGFICALALVYRHGIRAQVKRTEAIIKLHTAQYLALNNEKDSLLDDLDTAYSLYWATQEKSENLVSSEISLIVCDTEAQKSEDQISGEIQSSRRRKWSDSQKLSILKESKNPGITHLDLAKKYGVSRARISQICKEAADIEKRKSSPFSVVMRG